MKTTIKEVIVVEGKTDTEKLQSLFNVHTIETNGSYLSDKTISLIQKVALKSGVILFLDPDGPGEMIRRKLENKLINFKAAFIDKKSLKGKKKIGVAEASDKAIIKALKAVISFDKLQTSIS
jgi:ribonuclease M5